MNRLLEDFSELKNSTIKNYCWIRLFSKIINSELGEDVFVGFKTKIQNTKIESNVQIASQVKIGGKYLQTFIGRSTWIGARAVIREGITIGHHSVVGANTIVDFDVPPNTIVYGNPCVLKKRIYCGNKEPVFRAFLSEMLKNYEKGQNITQNKSGNFITADVYGQPKLIGKDNIMIGKKDGTGGGISFQKNIEISNNIILEGAGGITIGENCKIKNKVTIISNTHDYKYSSLPMVMQPVKIGENVIIGENTLILGGVIVPDNTVIKKNSFILKM